MIIQSNKVLTRFGVFGADLQCYLFRKKSKRSHFIMTERLYYSESLELVTAVLHVCVVHSDCDTVDIFIVECSTKH